MIYNVYCDASYRNKESRVGIVIYCEGRVITKYSCKIAVRCQQDSELKAIRLGFDIANLSDSVSQINVYTDSLSSQKMLSRKKSRIKNPDTKFLVNQMKNSFNDSGRKWTIYWIPREQNKEAHREAKL